MALEATTGRRGLPALNRTVYPGASRREITAGCASHIDDKTVRLSAKHLIKALVAIPVALKMLVLYILCLVLVALSSSS
ncbi:hypothetical protein HMPREF0733_10129 [Rothia dentocariosa ATCC 17931]|uniref:Uncharacterized protein n=1 Tax=Rothia dentocariosa (strain ATCC 17931 / CDC X599 / XDIA) TaxID=762948 RepID=E3H4W8_ROTDC|nr:hypothetical protein HMPREF0733_10129 [Rothia dentocariosa ATCC 17931]